MNGNGLVYIHKSVMIQSVSVPAELTAHITPAEYSSICLLVQNTQTESQNMALIIEFGGCLMMCLFCLFCAHPCITDAVFNSTLPP